MYFPGTTRVDLPVRRAELHDALEWIPGVCQGLAELAPPNAGDADGLVRRVPGGL